MLPVQGPGLTVRFKLQVIMKNLSHWPHTIYHYYWYCAPFSAIARFVSAMCTKCLCASMFWVSCSFSQVLDIYLYWAFPNNIIVIVIISFLVFVFFFLFDVFTDVHLCSSTSFSSRWLIFVQLSITRNLLWLFSARSIPSTAHFRRCFFWIVYLLFSVSFAKCWCSLNVL